MTLHSANIIRDLKSILTYHSSSGIDVYPSGDDLDLFFRCRVAEPESCTHVQPPVEVEKRELRSERPVQVRVPKPVRENLPTTTLQEIAAEVNGCTLCNLAQRRVVPVAGRGGEKVRLLVVGDWLAVQTPKHLPSGCLFGIEQDRMLGKMIDAIKLPRDQVFVSNVIKCGIPASTQPKAEHVTACLSYLHRQISILKPQVILSMGMIATRALLDRPEPLSRLRGRLHACNTKDDQKIPLIATYHPTYLLQNPEMKKATWFDLQMLAKQLGTAQG